MQPLEVSKGSLMQNVRLTDLLPGKNPKSYPFLLMCEGCQHRGDMPVILKTFPLRFYFSFLRLCRLLAMRCPLKRLRGLVWPQPKPHLHPFRRAGCAQLGFKCRFGRECGGKGLQRAEPAPQVCGAVSQRGSVL